DGKIVAAGVAGGFVALARYNADGSLDPTFGTGGVVFFGSGAFPGLHGAEGVALQPDGKIVVVAGLVARFNADGSLDASFGTSGAVLASGREFRKAVAVRPDGKINVVGDRPTTDGPDGRFLVERYNSDGSPDPSFGPDGTVTTAIGTTSG